MFLPNLGVARSRQTNKKGWAAKKRRELSATAHMKPAKKKSRKHKKRR
jgi:hypothetical protein